MDEETKQLIETAKTIKSIRDFECYLDDNRFLFRTPKDESVPDDLWYAFSQYYGFKTNVNITGCVKEPTVTFLKYDFFDLKQGIFKWNSEVGKHIVDARLAKKICFDKNKLEIQVIFSDLEREILDVPSEEAFKYITWIFQKPSIKNSLTQTFKSFFKNT